MCYGCIDFCTCTEPFVWDISNVFDDDNDLPVYPTNSTNHNGAIQQQNISNNSSSDSSVPHQHQYYQHQQQRINGDTAKPAQVASNVIDNTSISNFIEGPQQQSQHQYNYYCLQQQSLLIDNDHLSNHASIEQQTTQLNDDTNDNIWKTIVLPPNLSSSLTNNTDKDKNASHKNPYYKACPQDNQVHDNNKSNINAQQLPSAVKPLRSNNDDDINYNSNILEPCYWQFMQQRIDADNNSYSGFKNYSLLQQQSQVIVGNNNNFPQNATASYDNTNNISDYSSSCGIAIQEFPYFDNNDMKQQQQQRRGQQQQQQWEQHKQQLYNAFYPTINNNNFATTLDRQQQQTKQQYQKYEQQSSLLIPGLQQQSFPTSIADASLRKTEAVVASAALVGMPSKAVATKKDYEGSSSSSSASSVLSASLCKTASETKPTQEQQHQPKQKQQHQYQHEANNDDIDITSLKLLRPLSAYNYFFRDERDWIVHLGADNSPTERDFSNKKLQQILHKRWYQDPLKKKRSHARTHGKISFKDLSRVIAKRWKDLGNEGIEFYETAASLDLQRFQREKVLRQTQEHSNNT